MHIIRLNSADELCRYAATWDDLWLRSDVALPIARAEPLALWVRQFARRAKFRALAVEEAGQFVAALPLVGRRVRGLVRVADLPTNPWCPSGDLLLDPACDVPRVLDALLAAATHERWPLLWFEAVPVESPRWQAWLAAACRAGLQAHVRPRHHVGVIDRADDWDAFARGLSGDFRRNMRRRMRHLEQQGPLQLRVHDAPARQDVEALIRRAFEIEDRGWKGAKGTSVLRTPGMLDFFTRQAELLASWRQSAVFFLELSGQPIAFELGYYAKGTFFAHKVSYLPELAKEAPGHVLRWLQMQQFLQRAEFKAVDLFGKLTEAAERWATRSYPLARVVVAPPCVLSRALMTAYTAIGPPLRRVRGLWRQAASLP
jgi:CelD/BcsL family acetyltransferase involved in cellulose biosynthesis